MGDNVAYAAAAAVTGGAEHDLTVMSASGIVCPVAKSSVNTSPAAVDTLTPRGRKTRDALLDAARTVFETVGFLDARVEQIAQEAGVSYGTF